MGKITIITNTNKMTLHEKSDKLSLCFVQVYPRGSEAGASQKEEAADTRPAG